MNIVHADNPHKWKIDSSTTAVYKTNSYQVWMSAGYAIACMNRVGIS